MKLNIGIDIDGCLNNFQDVLGDILERDYNIIINKNVYENMTPLGYTRIEEYKEFWKKHDDEFFSSTKVTPRAPEIINKLKERHTINIITAREYNVASLTEKWLKVHNFEYDGLYFSATNKLDVCTWKSIDVMIEDKPENALLLANNGVRVILYDQPYNKNVIHPNIVHCESWEHINYYIENELPLDLCRDGKL